MQQEKRRPAAGSTAPRNGLQGAMRENAFAGPTLCNVHTALLRQDPPVEAWPSSPKVNVRLVNERCGQAPDPALAWPPLPPATVTRNGSTRTCGHSIY